MVPGDQPTEGKHIDFQERSQASGRGDVYTGFFGKMEEYRSRVYTDRPAYADLDAPEKFQAIMGIIMTHLRQHPKAICSYSGGSDSDIMIDLIETARKIAPSLPQIDYVFFNTGLEMKAIKDHVKATEEKYDVKIREVKPKVNIVQAVRKHGVPFVSKIMSAGLEGWQKKRDTAVNSGGICTGRR